MILCGNYSYPHFSDENLEAKRLNDQIHLKVLTLCRNALNSRTPWLCGPGLSQSSWQWCEAAMHPWQKQ